MEGKRVLFKRNPKPSAVDGVIESIQELLITGQIAPGDLLPSENEISEQLQVSRGSVREAFKILNAYGVVSIRRGDGTYVSDGANENMFTPLLFQILVRDRDFTSLIEMRELLELGILSLAIAHATQEDLDEIRRTMKEFEDALNGRIFDDVADYCKLDIAFHQALAAASHNAIVQEIYSFVIKLFEPSMEPLGAGVLESHRGMADAVLSRNVKKAERYLEDHTQSWTRFKKSHQPET